MSKPTPGPWELYVAEELVGNTWVESLPEGSIAIESRNGTGALGQAVAAVPFGNEANARLIAAAPELLEAIKRFLAGSVREQGAHSAECGCSLCAVFRAIAKADGAKDGGGA